MLEGIAFYKDEQNGQHITSGLQEIVKEVSRADERERGEVYLIVCMAVIQLPFARLSHLLPKDYSLCI